MPRSRLSRRKRAALAAILCLGLAYASLPQGIGWNQLAHYALVRALADGTAVIDDYRDETGDVAWVDGHYYAAKAPGLAMATLPAYLLLETTGLKDALARVPGVADEAVGMLWALGLVGCALPALAIAIAVRRLGDEAAPGFGTAAAVAAGAGTLLLPFATLFFSHVLAVALAFGAFALLWLRPRLALLAGVLAGLAVVVDYPHALAGLLVAPYAFVRGARAGAEYVAGAVAGVVPLLAYNWWALGSPTHLSYRNAVLVGGESGHDVIGANTAGFFGIGVPRPGVIAELLFAPVGLLRLSPVLALGALGLVLLWRRGLRAESATIGAVALAYLVYNSGYFQPFGGFVPGPRFLIPIIPFLAVALAPAFARVPLTSLLLGVASVALLTSVTITAPLLAFDGRWHERLLEGWFGGRPWWVVAPLVALVAAAVAVAVAATPARPARSEAPVAAAAVASWAAVWLVAPERLVGWTTSEVLAVTAAAAAGALATTLLARRVRVVPAHAG